MGMRFAKSMALGGLARTLFVKVLFRHVHSVGQSARLAVSSWLACTHFFVFEAVAEATRYENHVLKDSDFALVRFGAFMQRQLIEGKFVDI